MLFRGWMKSMIAASLLALAMGMTPAAQTVVSTHPPLSPGEAVRVLRASHSPADRTDAPFVDLSGPHIVIFRGSTTPWDWPADAYTPIAPLSNQPYGYGYGYGAPFWPYGGASVGLSFSGNRFASHIHDGRRERHQVALSPPPLPQAPPRSIVVRDSTAGVVRRR
jgi:hypothetical protein